MDNDRRGQGIGFIRKLAVQTPRRNLFSRMVIWVTAFAVSASPLTATGVLDWAPLFTRIDQPVSIPADIVNGAMLVDVTINGSGPFRMLVDTGCTCSVISPEVALAVQARSADDAASIPAVNALGTTGAVQHVLLDLVELNGVRFEGVEAGVTPLDLQSKITGGRIDGLLGYSLFSELFLALDFPNQRLRLSAGWQDNLPPIRADLNLVEHDSVPFAVLNVLGQSREMMIDTGANSGLEFDFDSTASLVWKFAPRPAGLVAAVNGMARDLSGRLSGAVVLGGVRQIDPVVTVGSGVPRVGTEFYRSFCVVFSRAQNKLWLCSASDGPIPSPPNRSLGLSLLADEGGWRVAGIIPGSPAERAHLVPGDLITSIENSPAKAWTRDELQKWIDGHAAVALRVTNSTHARELVLPVWSLVP